MKEFELKYGCNPNQKPAKIYMNGDKELYGEARLQDFLAAHRGASPRELLTLIFSELVRFRGEEPQSDDITMLAFCRTHSASVAQPASPRTSS